jgi:hypothetical protein
MPESNGSTVPINEDWKSARFTKTLPRLAVPKALHDSVHSFADANNMKLAEVMRKAIYLFLSSEFTNSTLRSSNGKQPGRKHSRKTKKQAGIEGG